MQTFALFDLLLNIMIAYCCSYFHNELLCTKVAIVLVKIERLSEMLKAKAEQFKSYDLNGNYFSVIIIYHDSLPTPMRGSHVKSHKTHTQSSTYTP